MSKTLKDCLLLAFITLSITLLIWLPHILALPNFWGLSFKEGFSTIYRNFDGLEYVVIAKTFYNPSSIASIPNSLNPNYYAAHFPGYAVLILLFAPILGYLKSMLFVSLLFTFLSTIVFYFLIKDFKLTYKPFFLSVLFLILPARWVIVHSVGSAEPMFIFFVILSLYAFMKYELLNKVSWLLLAAIGGVGAQITRPPGILLALAYFLYINYKKPFLSRFKNYPLILIPATLVLV